MPQCNSCGEYFEDYGGLARHVASSKKGHQRGKKWAAKYLTHVRSLARKEQLNGRTPLTEQEKDNKESTLRVLSGQNENVLTMCPKCNKGHRAVLPVEYTRSPFAWRKDKVLILLCEGCK